MKSVYIASTAKAAGNGIVEGYGIVFTNPEIRDLHGEYFSVKTNLQDDVYALDDAILLYHHGMDDSVGTKTFGRVLSAVKTDDGVWVRAQLNMRDEYEKYVYELVESGKLGWSSGALPASVKTSEGGHIDEWAVVEWSLTPTPAMPFATQVNAIKSVSDLPKTNLKSLLAAREAPRLESEKADDSYTDDTQNSDQNSQNEDVKMELTEEMRMLIRQEIEAIMAEMQEADDAEVDSDVEETMVEEAQAMLREEEIKMDEDDDDEEAAKSFIRGFFSDTKRIETLVSRAVTKSLNARAARKSAIRNAMSKAQQAAPSAASKADAVHGNKSMTPRTRISVSEDLRFAHLTPSEMALAVKIAHQSVPEYARKAWTPDQIFDESFLRHMAHKIDASVKAWDNDTRPQPASVLHDRVVAKAFHVKADEVNAIATTGAGAEWAGTFYDTVLWERARDAARLFSLMEQRGMRVIQVPYGDKMEMKTNPSSGTVYTLSESQDVDATGRPEVAAKISPFGTENVSVDLKTHILAQARTMQLEQSSLINVAQFMDTDAARTLGEALEDAGLNGDTTMTASTNINLGNGTPGTGISAQPWLAWDGIRHNALVDNTAYKVDAKGALNAEIYNVTKGLLDSAIQPQRDSLMYVISPEVESATRRLPEFATWNAAGERATIFTGTIEQIEGLPVYTSGFLRLSTADGTVDSTGNTVGTILCVYPRYWQYGRQQAITIETVREPLSQTSIVVASVRHAFASFGASAASIAYNVGV